MVPARQVSLPPTPPSEPVVSANTIVNDVLAKTSKINYKHIFVLCGPAGCGKTTIAKHLQSELGMAYLEGDEFHTKENITKMSNGQPLSDTERWDWLVLLREQSLKFLEGSTRGVLITCSALKQKYRDVFRIAAYYDQSIRVHFLFLDVGMQSLVDRMRLREDHYMKENMVASQLEGLERPRVEEVDALRIDGSLDREEVRHLALEIVQRTLKEI